MAGRSVTAARPPCSCGVACGTVHGAPCCIHSRPVLPLPSPLWLQPMHRSPHLDGGVEVHGLAGGGGRRGLLHRLRALPSAAGMGVGAGVEQLGPLLMAAAGRRRRREGGAPVGQLPEPSAVCKSMPSICCCACVGWRRLLALQRALTRQTCWSSTDKLPPLSSSFGREPAGAWGAAMAEPGPLQRAGRHVMQAAAACRPHLGAQAMACLNKRPWQARRRPSCRAGLTRGAAGCRHGACSLGAQRPHPSPCSISLFTGVPSIHPPPSLRPARPPLHVSPPAEPLLPCRDPPHLGAA